MIRAESEPRLVGPVRKNRITAKCKNTVRLPYNLMNEGCPVCPTLSEEQALTFDAAMMKSRINMVAPGRPMLKNFGLQCFMMVLTMSYRNHTKQIHFSILLSSTGDALVLFKSRIKLFTHIFTHT